MSLSHRCLLLTVFLLGLAPPARGEERFALVIGANLGWANDKPLRYAESDAERMRDVLVELGGFSAERVVLLRDPDTAEVRARLRQLSETLRMLGAKSLVLVYFAGHADERGLHLRGAKLSRQDLWRTLTAMPATRWVGVLDVCNSGARDAAPSLKWLDAKWDEGVDGVVAEGMGEVCRAKRGAVGNTLTHHLVSGLRGAADAKGDGAVRLDEAVAHALLQLQADAPAESPPRRTSPLLTTPSQGRAWLVSRGEAERHVVLDADEVRAVAEVRARPDGDAVLALPPGRYRVKRLRGAQLEVADVTLMPGARVETSSLQYTVSTDGICLVRCRPEGLEDESLHEWQRGEALRLLASGSAEPARELFARVLSRWPEDEGARRGEARARVRQAEVLGRQGQWEREQEELRAALEADPSLSEDADFRENLRRIRAFEGKQTREATLRELRWEEAQRNPRRAYRWGLGLELVGTRGALAPTGTLVLDGHWFLHGSLDLLAGRGVDVGARFVPGNHRLSPFLGAGFHLSLRGPEVDEMLWYFFGTNAHVDVGVQLFTEGGFSLEFGFSAIRILVPRGTAKGFAPMLNLGMSFFFK